MNSKARLSVFLLFLLWAGVSEAKLAIVTTTSNAKALVEEVAGDFASVLSFTEGGEDPHYLEAKPSFMIKLARSDLLVAIGLDLEIGWLPAILKGARNPDIQPGSLKYLELGDHISPLEVMERKASRLDGHVHEKGNPHFLLDPISAAKCALVVAKRLAKIDPANKAYYFKRAESFKKRMELFTKKWQDKLAKKKQPKLITYHKTLSYFLARFNLRSLGSIEAKPGISPSPKYFFSLIEKIKREKVSLALIEHYFDDKAALRLQKDAPQLKVKKVSVSVHAERDLSSLELLYTHLARATYEGLL